LSSECRPRQGRRFRVSLWPASNNRITVPDGGGVGVRRLVRVAGNRQRRRRQLRRLSAAAASDFQATWPAAGAGGQRGVVAPLGSSLSGPALPAGPAAGADTARPPHDIGPGPLGLSPGSRDLVAVWALERDERDRAASPRRCAHTDRPAAARL